MDISSSKLAKALLFPTFHRGHPSVSRLVACYSQGFAVSNLSSGPPEGQQINSVLFFGERDMG